VARTSRENGMREEMVFKRCLGLRGTWSKIDFASDPGRRSPCPVWVISGHVRLHEKASALPLKADIAGRLK
jgi:hypothetical protein